MRGSGPKATTPLGCVLLGCVLLAACTSGVRTGPAVRSDRPSPTSAPSSTSTAPASSAAPARGSAVPAASNARAVLSTIAIKGRAPLTGYDRDRFGTAWTDDNDDRLGHNGCDTRNDILRRDLRHVVIEPGTHGCKVLTGTLPDPYSGRGVPFVHGQRTSAAVQIDHVVALGDAWQTGAQRWDVERRVDFANDPLNLLAVNGSANESKGDGDAATWLPPNKAYRCAYVARQVAVKARYGLWMTPAEHATSERILSGCPDLTVPDGGGPAAASSESGSGTSLGSSSPGSSTRSAYYATCADARAAGATPLYRGRPGYRPELDGDDDGVACE